MPAKPVGYRECYRHPKRPALRDCAVCKQPICKLCFTESEDDHLCGPCKEALLKEDQKEVEHSKRVRMRARKTGESPEVKGAGHEKAHEIPEVKPPSKDSAPFVLGEVTVHDDGRIEEPSKPVKEEPPETGELEEQAPPVGLEPAAQPPEEKPIEPSINAVEKHRERTAYKDTAKTPVTAPVKKEKEKRVVGSVRPQADTRNQVLGSIPYGLAAAASVYVFWFVIAVVRKQWTQTAVLTAGMVAPWALFKGSTARKRMGIHVWKEKPPALWLAIVSTSIMVLFFPIIEYLAFEFTLAGSKLPFSDFAQRYSKASDWVLILCGFALSFIIPFILKIGEGWRAPSLRRKRKR